MMDAFPGIEGFLLDLNGVFYVGDRLIDGAVETIKAFKTQNIPCRYLTNTTTQSIETFHRRLLNLGLPIEKSDIISAPYAAVLHLRQMDDPKCYLLLSDDAQQDFREFRQSDTEPDAIVIGDIGDRWDYNLMNDVFGKIVRGAELVALHKGRYWQGERGLQLDIGAFVTGLEYASGKTATVIGKPSLSFFKLALSDLGLSPYKVALIGDDINADVGGAQNAGIMGVLVKTGKYRPELAERVPVSPDRILNSIADLPALLS
ncbi:MAG: TIGR01458 family HAD-type hydrolase [Cyanobacteria bacterium SID2]|nr:TIGR01458 family HAD-type hydrolase [Cyanobacteria bacterium SID2]MBP0003391.1 TIGR01458 family HAD-type hydrolase [Cyanobacteria bacterium SBC]